jgi:hypothetical protein
MAPKVGVGMNTETRAKMQGHPQVLDPRESIPPRQAEEDPDDDFKRDPVIGKRSNTRFKRNSLGHDDIIGNGIPVPEEPLSQRFSPR